MFRIFEIDPARLCFFVSKRPVLVDEFLCKPALFYQIPIDLGALQQFFVGTHRIYLSGGQYQDAVCFLDGLHSVGNEDNGSVFSAD